GGGGATAGEASPLRRGARRPAPAPGPARRTGGRKPAARRRDSKQPQALSAVHSQRLLRPPSGGDARYTVAAALAATCAMHCAFEPVTLLWTNREAGTPHERR